MAKREMKKQNAEATEVVETAEEANAEQSTPVVEEKSKPKNKEGSITKGVVAGCEKLNIRKAPKSDAPVVTIVDAGTELKIFDPDKAINGWYKTEKGFCMKQYVKIK